MDVPFVPDTCVFVTAFRQPKSRLALWLRHNQKRIMLSAIVLAELHRQWDPRRPAREDREDRNKQIIEQEVVSCFDLLPFDQHTAKVHGRVYRSCRGFCGSHQADGFIASHALQVRGVCVTEEVSEFSKIPILQVWGTKNGSEPAPLSRHGD